MTTCYLSIGGNLGDVAETFRQALDCLDRSSGIAVTRVSETMRTEPVGADVGGEFLNAAAEFACELEPLELLELLKQVEADLGRRAPARRWTARSIDLDLILFGDRVAETDRLSLPHPGCWYRRFVLDPLCRIAGDVEHPVYGLLFETLRRRLLARPLTVSLDEELPAEQRRSLADVVAKRSPEAAVIESHGGMLDVTLGPIDATAGHPRVVVPDDADRARTILQDVLDSALGAVEPHGDIPGWPAG